MTGRQFIVVLCIWYCLHWQWVDAYNFMSKCDFYCMRIGKCNCNFPVKRLEITTAGLNFSIFEGISDPENLLFLHLRAPEVAYCAYDDESDRCKIPGQHPVKIGNGGKGFSMVKRLNIEEGSNPSVNHYEKLKYVSSAFLDRFPSLERLTIKRNKLLDIIEPVTKKENNNKLKIIFYNDNNKVCKVKSNDVLLSALETFQYSATDDLSIDSLEIDAIKPGPAFRKFSITSRAKRLVINMPINTVEDTIQDVEVDYRGGVTDGDGEIEWNYNKNQGSIEKMTLTLSLKSKSSDFTQFVPDEMMNNKKTYNQFQINFRYEEDNAEEYLVHKISTNAMENLVRLDDQATLESFGYFPEMFPAETEYTINETISFNYLVINLEDALKNVQSEAKKLSDDNLQKEYIINTHILIWGKTSAFKLNTVTVNYRMLMHHEDPRLFFLQPKDSSNPERVKFNSVPMNLKQMYELMVATSMIGKPSQLDNIQQSDAKRKVLLRLMSELKDINPFIFQNPTSQSYFVNDAQIKKIQVLLFIERRTQTTAVVPRLSKSIYKEKTIAYQEMGKNLLQKEKFANVNQGQKNLLRITKIKTQTQRLIAAKQQASLFNRLKQQNETLEKFSKLRRKYEQEVQAGEGKFKAAVRRREQQVKVDAAFAVIDAVFSVISGGINALKAVGSIIDSFKSIKDALDAIKQIMDKIKRLEQTTLKWFKKIASKFKHVGEFATKITTAQHALTISDAGFDPGNITEMVKQVGEIDATDLLKWDIAIADVETMMDSALTAEIPATYGYKKSLLRMMAAGRAETEATLKKAEIQANIVLKEYEMKTYKEEEDQINFLNKRLDQGVSSSIFDENFGLTRLQYKLEMFLHLVDYCDASFYYSLSPCDTYSHFHYHTTLEEIIHLTNKMLVEDVDNLNDLYPPPQSFFDKKIEFNWNLNCTAVIKKVAANDTLTAGEISIQDECQTSKIAELLQEKEMSFSVPLFHKEFNIFERVRVEEVKIFVKNARTTSGKLTVNIESSGLSQDRFGGQIHTFLGDKWKRTFRYRLSTDGEGNRYEIKGDIHKSFTNHFNLPTPFTNWIITLPSNQNEGLNLQRVTGVEVFFSGQLMVSSGSEMKTQERPIYSEYFESLEG